MRKDGEKRGEGKRGEERGQGGEKWIEGNCVKRTTWRSENEKSKGR
jgi:hypothetical protein